MFNVVPIKNSKKSIENEEIETNIIKYRNMNELKEAFKSIEEKTDKVNPENVVKLFRQLGYEGSSQGLIDLFEYLTNVSDKEGLVNYEQFLQGCQKILGQNGPDDYLKRVFGMYADKKEKNNQVISYESFVVMMKTLGDNLTNEEAKDSFIKYSENKDYLTFEDFLKIFNGE